MEQQPGGRRVSDSAEVKIAALTERVKGVEDTGERLTKQMHETQRYTNVMLEDMIGRMSKMERQSARFEENLVHVNSGNGTTITRLAAIETRLLSIERLAWTAAGGMGCITALCVFIGWQALKVLLK